MGVFSLIFSFSQYVCGSITVTYPVFVASASASVSLRVSNISNLANSASATILHTLFWQPQYCDSSSALVLTAFSSRSPMLSSMRKGDSYLFIIVLYGSFAFSSYRWEEFKYNF